MEIQKLKEKSNKKYEGLWDCADGELYGYHILTGKDGKRRVVIDENMSLYICLSFTGKVIPVRWNPLTHQLLIGCYR